MPTLLVVDDEPNVLYSLERSLHSDSLQVVTAQTAGQGLNVVRNQCPDVVLLDVRLPDQSGLDAFVQIHALYPRLPVIMMTAFTSTETAIEAIKRGAFEYLLKPVDLHQLREALARALEVRRTATPEIEPIELPDAPSDGIVGTCPAMQQVYKAIGRVAPLDVNVLVLGESGTGKELVAQAIVQHSPRAQQPLVTINCAAIPETLLESELFGHEQGAFTGADRRAIGKFEQADGGTILLDEIGDMSLATQGKVLRVLQGQCFERLGGNQSIQTNVRVIAATNRNLEELVAAGRFRSDLYYRLKVFTIQMPPLAQRLGDVGLLIDHFLRLYARELGKPRHTLTEEARKLLVEYPWPGNVRELQGAIKHALVNARGGVITPECLPPVCRHAGVGSSTMLAPGLDVTALVRRLLNAGQGEIYHQVQDAVDRVLLEEVLRHVQGNQVEASNRLGISRTTLRAKLRAIELANQRQMKLPSGTTEPPTTAEVDANTSRKPADES